MSINKRMAAMALTACAGFALLAAPAYAQSLGGLGQPTRKPDHDAPSQPPREPAKPREPTPPPPPEPTPPPPPEPTPTPPPEPPAPAPPQPEVQPAPAPTEPGPSDNAPVIHDTRPGPSDNAPVGPASPGRSSRVTTPIGQQPEPHHAPRPDDGDYLYPAPTVIIVPPVIVVPPPAPAPLPPPPTPTVPGQSVPLPSAPAKTGWPEGTPQAAFADIERAWTRRDLAALRRHLRNGDTKVGVSVGGKFAYSLSSRDFLSLTGTALGRLHTVTFRFTRLRHAANGDVTAFGKHIYSVPPARVSKTVYVSYTLRRSGAHWYVIGVDSSPKPFVRQTRP